MIHQGAPLMIGPRSLVLIKDVRHHSVGAGAMLVLVLLLML
jgi:hypothetical protein